MTENGQPQMIHADMPRIAANINNLGLFWSAFIPNPVAHLGLCAGKKYLPGRG